MTPKMLEALRIIGPNGSLTQVHWHRHTTDVKFSCANRVMSKRVRGATASALVRGGFVSDKGGIGGLDFSDYRTTDKGRAALASDSKGGAARYVKDHAHQWSDFSLQCQDVDCEALRSSGSKVEANLP